LKLQNPLIARSLAVGLFDVATTSMLAVEAAELSVAFAAMRCQAQSKNGAHRQFLILSSAPPHKH